MATVSGEEWLASFYYQVLCWGGWTLRPGGLSACAETISETGYAIAWSVCVGSGVTAQSDQPAHPVWILGRAGLGQGGGKQGHSAGTRPTTPALTTGCHPVLYHTCRLGLRLRLEALRLLLPGRSEERGPELDLELQCRAQAEQQVERFNFALAWLSNGGGRFEDD